MKYKNSIQKKLNVIILTISAISLLLAGLAFIIKDWYSFQEIHVDEMKSQAKMVSFYSVAPLEFNDKDAGEEILKGLKADPRIRSAALFYSNGELFASFRKKGKNVLPLPDAPKAEGSYSRENHIEIYLPVGNSRELLGTLYISSDMGYLKDRLKWYAIFGMGVLSISMVVAYFLSSRFQRRISSPILDLAQTAEVVSNEKDYSIRARKLDEDEVGLLVDRFNEMLTQIQQRDIQVHEAREGLERKVEERTHDLKQEIEVRRKVEGELIQSKEMAEQASAAKTEFLSRMSHELRTPLNAIIGFGQVLESVSEDPLTDSQLECVNHITRGGKHLLDLINEVLSLSKIELGETSLSIEPVDLERLLEKSLTFVGPIVREKNVKIINNIKSEVPIWVEADRVRLNQVILNLLSNAVKYNRQDGTVTLNFEKVDEHKGRIHVEDTGLGISQEKQEKIFEPFNRLGAEFTDVQGTGIGLTIVKSLMELMHGTIYMKSTPDVGSCFTLEVPLPETMPAQIETEPAPEKIKVPLDNANGKPYSLLYVEDNPFNLRLIQSIVKRRPNINFMSASTAEEGLDLAKEFVPHLILMDMNLPGMNGTDALKELKKMKETKHIPVIALSADAMENNIQSAIKEGFEDYMTKPIDVHEFFAVLDRFA